MPLHPLRLCRLDERPLLGAKQLAFPSAHFRNCQAALFLDLHDPTRLRLSGRRRQPSKGLNERQSLHLATKSDLAVDAKTNDVEDFLARVTGYLLGMLWKVLADYPRGGSSRSIRKADFVPILEAPDYRTTRRERFVIFGEARRGAPIVVQKDLAAGITPPSRR